MKNTDKKEQMEILVKWGRPRRDIYVIPEETEPAPKTFLEKRWRKYLNQRYRELRPVPICCETCRHVGEKMWHCHCPESPKQHLNVSPFSVCTHWMPNAGLLMLLERARWQKLFSATGSDGCR